MTYDVIRFLFVLYGYGFFYTLGRLQGAADSELKEVLHEHADDGPEVIALGSALVAVMWPFCLLGDLVAWIVSLITPLLSKGMPRDDEKGQKPPTS